MDVRTFTLRDEVVVRAPVYRCFLLSTSIAIVQKELGMKPVAGRTAGLVRGGDTVLWKGWKFGMPQFHQSAIDKFEPGHFFQDRMVAGRFASFEHDHAFMDRHNGTVLLRDELRFSLPFGWAGRLVGRIIVKPYICRLMRRRFALIKRIAETEEWRAYLPEA